MLKKVFAMIMVLVFAINLGACANSETTSNEMEETSLEPSVSPTPRNITPTPQPTHNDESDSETEIILQMDFKVPEAGVRPYAVMIDNQGNIPLPQGGLHKAQLIYEIIVEGGITRLMPVFWGTEPQMIGPVRSARHYFIDYAMEHDAIYVHIGWSPMAQRDISAFKINNINGLYAGSPFWELTNDSRNWQDTYTSMERLLDYTGKVKYRTSTEKNTVFTYNESAVIPEDGLPAHDINVRYPGGYKCGFVYDKDKGVYMRTREGQPHMERETGRQLSVVNIIIPVIRNTPIPGDPEGRQELHNIGSGEGWYITMGKAVKIKWSKSSRESRTRYTYLDGRDITLNRGQTWIQIVWPAENVTISG